MLMNMASEMMESWAYFMEELQHLQYDTVILMKIFTRSFNRRCVPWFRLESSLFNVKCVCVCVASTHLSLAGESLYRLRLSAHESTEGFWELYFHTHVLHNTHTPHTTSHTTFSNVCITLNNPTSLRVLAMMNEDAGGRRGG